MSDPPPPVPQDEPAHEPERQPQVPAPPARQPQPQRGGGSVVLGILIGVLFIAALIGLSILLAPIVPYFVLPALVLFLAYVVVAGVLSGRRATARFGAGLFIAVGVSVLVGAGVCVAVIARSGL
jgi:predicted lipid-binding transport protein (Tim44 family)